MGRLDTRVAVVTGAGQGLGRAYAIALAAEGAAVVVNDLDADAARAVAREIDAAGGHGLAAPADVSSLDAAEALVTDAAARLGRVDIVVNNAGVSRPAPIAAIDDAALDLHLGVHLKATVGTTKAAFAAMEGRGGCIVNTVSGHAFDPRAGNSAAYAAAKGAVSSFTRAAAREGAPLGIAVNAVAPLAYTAMSEEYLARVPDAAARLAPEHVARLVVELACAPPDVTGRILRVEGELVGEYEFGAPGLVPFERISEVLGARAGT